MSSAPRPRDLKPKETEKPNFVEPAHGIYEDLSLTQRNPALLHGADLAVEPQRAAQVALGNATTVDFELNTSDVQAVVEVTNDSGVIVDATETKAQDNITA